MEILLFNTGWMIFNILLAVLPIILAMLAVQWKDKRILKYLTLFLWLDFVPNTLYLLTDIIHIPGQWVQLNFTEGIVMIFQYLILGIAGVVTFILSLYAFQKALKTFKFKKATINILIIAVNFFIGFGVALGRFERANSWEVITNPSVILESTVSILSSVELVGFSLFFGILGNFIYFCYKERMLKFVKNYFPGLAKA